MCMCQAWHAEKSEERDPAEQKYFGLKGTSKVFGLDYS